MTNFQRELDRNPWRLVSNPDEIAAQREQEWGDLMAKVPSPYGAEVADLENKKAGLAQLDAAFSKIEQDLFGSGAPPVGGAGALTDGVNWATGAPAAPAMVSQPVTQPFLPAGSPDTSDRIEAPLPAIRQPAPPPSLASVTGDPAAGMPDVWPAGAAETSAALDPRGERRGLATEQVAPLTPEQPAGRGGAQAQETYGQQRVHGWEPTTSEALDGAMSGSLAEGMRKAVPEMGQALREQVDRIPIPGRLGEVVRGGGRAVVNRVEQIAHDMAETQGAIEEQGARGNAVGALASAGGTAATTIPASAQAAVSGLTGSLAKGLLGNDDDVFEWAKGLGIKKETPVLGGLTNPVELSSAVVTPATFVDRAVGTLLHLGASGIRVTPAIVREVARQNAIDADVLLAEVVKEGSRLAGPATEAGTRLVEGGVKAATGALEGTQDLAARAVEGVQDAADFVGGVGRRLAGEPSGDRVVPLAISRRITNQETAVPGDPEFRAAVEAAGGSVTDTEVVLPVSRYQKSVQGAANLPTLQGGTFLTAGRPEDSAYRGAGADHPLSGTQAVHETTTYRKPLVVQGAVSELVRDLAPEALGALDEAALAARAGDPSALAALFSRHGIPAEDAERIGRMAPTDDIAVASAHERLAAELARKQGHDVVIALRPGGGGIEELLDLRVTRYPGTTFRPGTLHPDVRVTPTTDRFGVPSQSAPFSQPNTPEALVLANPRLPADEMSKLPGMPGSGPKELRGTPRTQSTFATPVVDGQGRKHRQFGTFDDKGRRVAATPYEYVRDQATDFSDYRDWYSEWGRFFRDLATDDDGVFRADQYDTLTALMGATAAQASPLSNMGKTLAAAINWTVLKKALGRDPSPAELDLAMKTGKRVQGGQEIRDPGLVRLGVTEEGGALKVGPVTTLWPASDSKKTHDLMTTGRYRIGNGAKVATFGQDIRERGIHPEADSPYPYTVNDTHVWRNLGYEAITVNDPQTAHSNTAAYRAVTGLLNAVADELGWTPDQVQSAIWFASILENAPRNTAIQNTLPIKVTEAVALPGGLGTVEPGDYLPGDVRSAKALLADLIGRYRSEVLAEPAVDGAELTFAKGGRGLGKAVWSVGNETLANAQLARRELDFLKRSGAGAQSAGAPGIAAPGRYFHGTGASFERPDPDKFDPDGLYGPGYYLTSDPRVASSYAANGISRDNPDALVARIEAVRANLADPTRSEIDHQIDATLLGNLEKRLERTRAQVRPVDVPRDADLFDVDGVVSPQDFERIRGIFTRTKQAGMAAAARDGDLRGDWVYDELLSIAGDNETANRALAEAGWHGIRYDGGKRIPLRGEDGRPITHTAVMMFPEGLGKVTNALSGQPMGAVAGAGRRAHTALASAGDLLFGRPLPGEEGAGLAGSLAGGAAGASQIKEEDDLGTRAGKIIGGAAAGAVLGREGNKLVRAIGDEAGARRAGVVPVDVAKTLPGDVRLPDDPAFRAAVEATPGAALTPDGLELDLTRWQKPRQAGRASARTAVFYGVGEEGAEGYATRDPRAPLGGSQQITGRTLLKRPLVVQTGGSHDDLGIGAYAALAGDEAANRLWDETGDLGTVWLREGAGALTERITALLDEHGIPEARKAAEAIVSTSPGMPGTAVEELVTATAARRAGFDSILGVTDGGVIDQLADLRESKYPTPAVGFWLNPEATGGSPSSSGIVAGATRGVTTTAPGQAAIPGTPAPGALAEGAQAARRLLTGWRQATPDQRWSDAGKVGGALQSARVSGMLSGTAGALGDVISNSLNLPRLYWRTAAGAAVERLMGVPGDQRATTLSEVKGINAGIASGVRLALTDALKALVQGGDPIRADAPKNLVNGPAGLLLETGGRVRLFADTLISHLGETVGANMLAHRQASREGLGYGSREYKDRVAALVSGIEAELAKSGDEAVGQGGTAHTPAGQLPGIDSPGFVRDLAAEARAIAKRLVFQEEPGWLAHKVGSLRDGEDPGKAGGLVGLAVPFFRTLANISAEGVTMTPGAGLVGTLGDLGASAAFGKGAYSGSAGHPLARTNTSAVLPASQRVADQALGVGVALLGATLYATGAITGPMPTDRRQRDPWQKDGRQPFSWVSRSPDGTETYTPLTRLLGPVAFPLVFGVAAAQAHERGESVGPFVESLVGVVQDYWFEQSGLRGFDDLLTQLRGDRGGSPLSNAGRLAERNAASWVPLSGLLRTIANATDDTLRDPEGLAEVFKAGLPGLSHTVPARRDRDTGETINRSPGQSGARAILPLQSATDRGRSTTRRYVGSKNAVEDAERAAAIQKVGEWSKDRSLPRPSEREFDLARTSRETAEFRQRQRAYQETQKKREKVVTNR